MPLPTHCVSAFICSSGLFLTWGWPPDGFSRSGSLCFLFTSPDLPFFYHHSFPRPSLGTGRLISPSCQPSFSPLFLLCCLGIWLLPCGPPTQHWCGLFTADAPVWEQLLTHACLHFWSLPPAALLATLEILSPWDGVISCGRVSSSLCMHPSRHPQPHYTKSVLFPICSGGKCMCPGVSTQFCGSPSESTLTSESLLLFTRSLL